MPIHNRDIYHCLRCGRLVRQEQDVPPPTCCGGLPMVKAASETVPGTLPESEPVPDRPRDASTGVTAPG